MREIVVRVACAAILLLLPSLASAQESKSATAASELVKLLEQQKLDSVAAAQPGNQFVSALYVPGSQLLVVRGRFASPERATILIDRKMYRDVYTDLNSAAEAEGKLFISDLGADGLKFRRQSNQPFDTADMAGRSYAFDGEWGRAKLSRDEYTKAYQTADEQYSQMLQALIEQLKKSS